MGKPPIIYGMVDPRNGNISYIGKTVDLIDRRGWHLADQRECPRAKWIQELLSMGLAPIMVKLEEVRPYRNWPERERYWIQRGKELHWPLLNQSEGGEGGNRYNNQSQRRGKTPNPEPVRTRTRRGGNARG